MESAIPACRYTEQFERMKRWYERFKRIDEGASHEKNIDYIHDEVYAFFLNCYHLKDWIKQDSSVPRSASSSVEYFITDSRSLSICADVCNSVKRLALTQINQGTKPILAVKYSIETVTGLRDAFEIAGNCVREWEHFIESNIP